VSGSDPTSGIAAIHALRVAAQAAGLWHQGAAGPGTARSHCRRGRSGRRRRRECPVILQESRATQAPEVPAGLVRRPVLTLAPAHRRGSATAGDTATVPSHRTWPGGTPPTCGGPDSLRRHPAGCLIEVGPRWPFSRRCLTESGPPQARTGLSWPAAVYGDGRRCVAAHFAASRGHPFST